MEASANLFGRLAAGARLLGATVTDGGEARTDVLASVKAKVRWSHDREADAARRLHEAQSATEFWHAVEKEILAGNPASVLLILRRGEPQIRRLVEAGDPIVSELNQLRAHSEAQARKASQSFERGFPEAVRAAGIEIDSTSRFPRYNFKRGFVRVEVDDRQLTARISPRDGEDLVLGLDVGPLVQRLKGELVRIFERKPDRDALLRSLYTAYVAVLRAEKRPEGEEVPLRRVSNRLAKNLNRFAGDEFNVDLAQLVTEGYLSLGGKRMHLNHTRNARQGMLLYGLEEGGYVGFLSFKEEGQQ